MTDVDRQTLEEEIVGFLTGLAQALSAMRLYEAGHPARDAVIQNAYQRLRAAQAVRPTFTLTFLGSEIVLDDSPLRELRRWDWTRRFAERGIQRIELEAPVEAGDFTDFVNEAYERLKEKKRRPDQQMVASFHGIRFGAVGVTQTEIQSGSPDEPLETATVPYVLGGEAEAVQWLLDELRESGDLHLVEAEVVVRSLAVAMHSGASLMLPLLRLKRTDEYSTSHALNVALLAMALAEYLGLGPKEVQTFGTAGLLYDIGRTQIPKEILEKAGSLTAEEWRIVERHPEEGARIILATEKEMDLAAVVAYEHHLRPDGGGYPKPGTTRPPHPASELIHLCDVYDALRSDRPYREGWDEERALNYVLDGAGTEFNPDLARAFVNMMRDWGEPGAEEGDEVGEVESEDRGGEGDDAAAAGEGPEEAEVSESGTSG